MLNLGDEKTAHCVKPMEVEVEFKIASPLERRHSRVLRDRRNKGDVDSDSE